MAEIETPLQTALPQMGSKELSIGTPVSQIYQSNVNQVRLKEDVVYYQNYKQAFNSLQTNSQGVVLNLNNIGVVSNVYARYLIPQVPVNVSLPRGWAFHNLSRIDIRMGSSITLSFDYPQLFAMIMNSCDSDSKADEILRLAGDEVITSTASIQEAVIPFDFVFSKVRYIISKLPYDAGILNQPIQLVIYHRGLDQVAGGSGVAAWINSFANQFVKATFHVKTGAFQNQIDSIKQDLMMNPQLTYAYHWVYPQTQQFRFGGSVLPTKTTLNLTGFKSGDLLGIQMIAVKETDIIGTLPGDARNMFNSTADLGGMVLTYNGQVLWDMDDSVRLAKLIGACSGLKGAYFPSSRITQGSSTGPWVSSPVKSYIYNIDFTLQPSKDQEGSSIAHGLKNVQNSSMQLQFSTPDTATYILYVSYLYQCSVRSEGGNAEFVF